MNALRLYARYIGVSLRGQMEYRTSFLMQTAGYFLATVIEFIGIWVLFARFKMLVDWTLPEVALFYGLVHVAFPVTEMFARGFDIFPMLVKSGDFDRILLRPRSTAFQVAAREIHLMRVGGLLQGAAVLAWAMWALDLDWTAAKALLVAFAITGGVFMFAGLLILQATLSFWTIETLEIVNTVTYGGKETGHYPLTIYADWMRKFFTFVVPLACVSYFPAVAILGRGDAALGSPLWFQHAAPGIGIVFFLVSLGFWSWGVKHYASTGS